MKYSFNTIADANLKQVSIDFIEVSKAFPFDPGASSRINSINQDAHILQQMMNHTSEIGLSQEISLIKIETDQSEDLFSIAKRRKSIREFADTPLSFNELSQLIQKTYFIVDKNPVRFNIPSGGGLYPSEIFIFNIRTKDLECGIYHYNPYNVTLELLESLDEVLVNELLQMGFSSNNRSDINFSKASAIILICSHLNKTTFKYGDRGIRFAMFDIGAILYSLYLNSTQMNIAICGNGGYYDDYLAEKLQLRSGLQSVLITAVVGNRVILNN